MSISVIITALISLFIMLFIGYGMTKAGLANKDFNARLTKLVLNITVPCTVLDSVLKQEGERNLGALAMIVVIGIVYFALTPLIGMLFCKVLRAPKDSRGTYIFITMFTNVGFMGYPVCNVIYGPKGVFYAAIFNILFNVIVFTFGPALITCGMEDKATINLKNIMNPASAMSLAAVVIYLSGIHFPAVLEDTIGSIGAMTTPLAMMITGISLGFLSVKEIFGDVRAYLFILLRQVLLPLALIPVYRLLIPDDMVRGVCYIMAIMPAGAVSVLLTTDNGGDVDMATRILFISTLASLLTLPVQIMLCIG